MTWVLPLRYIFLKQLYQSKTFFILFLLFVARRVFYCLSECFLCDCNSSCGVVLDFEGKNSVVKMKAQSSWIWSTKIAGFCGGFFVKTSCLIDYLLMPRDVKLQLTFLFWLHTHSCTVPNLPVASCRRLLFLWLRGPHLFKWPLPSRFARLTWLQ